MLASQLEPTANIPWSETRNPLCDPPEAALLRSNNRDVGYEPGAKQTTAPLTSNWAVSHPRGEPAYSDSCSPNDQE